MRIKRILWLLVMLTPSVSLASGDVGVIWKALAGFTTYALVAAVLIFLIFKRHISPLRLVAFVAVSALSWYWYTGTRPPHHPLEFVIFLVVPLAFLIRARRPTQ